MGVPLAALEGVPVRWVDWAQIDALRAPHPERWRNEALIARPQIIGALRDYDLAEINLKGEVAKRWPQVRIQPAYAWGGQGVREDALDEIASESALGVSFELPIFNQHQGPIGEALARRTAAGEHLKAVQAAIYGQIDRAELGWPAARSAPGTTRGGSPSSPHAQSVRKPGRCGAGAATAASARAPHRRPEARLAVLEAAYAAQVAFGALEDAYRRPLEGAEGPRA